MRKRKGWIGVYNTGPSVAHYCSYITLRARGSGFSLPCAQPSSSTKLLAALVCANCHLALPTVVHHLTTFSITIPSHRAGHAATRSHCVHVRDIAMVITLVIEPSQAIVATGWVGVGSTATAICGWCNDIAARRLHPLALGLPWPSPTNFAYCDPSYCLGHRLLPKRHGRGGIDARMHHSWTCTCPSF